MSTTIVKGDELMVFKVDDSTTPPTNTAWAWATSHTLSMTGNTVDIATKDHGFWGASEVGKITWQVTSENLYCDDGYDDLFDAMVNKTELTIAFAKVSNYDENGLTSVGGDVAAWEADATNYRSGKAVITSLEVNANTGENATYSVTFTGAGPLVKAEANNG